MEKLLEVLSESKEQIVELREQIKRIEVIVEDHSRKSRIETMTEHVLVGVLVTLVIHFGGEKIATLLFTAGSLG